MDGLRHRELIYFFLSRVIVATCMRSMYHAFITFKRAEELLL